MLNIKAVLRYVYSLVLFLFHTPILVSVTENEYVLKCDVTKPNMNKYLFQSQALEGN